MDPERWRRVQQLLDQALELRPEEREGLLAEVDSKDPSLAREVRSLLSQEKHDSFLERPAARQLAAELDHGSGSIARVDGLLEPYRIVSEIGRGGMGVVYQAEQQEPVRRTVALKVIQSGMDTDQVLARFETERQALALMSHPAIARVLDAGTTTDGRPYFSMEYVDGVPITEYCDRHRLTVRSRLELFIRVCHGIQHAHQKGIIHRDIKPSNVLVIVEDDTPSPRIIDFGVAKATTRGLIGDHTLTEVGQFVGTLAYMSPEQAQLTDPDIDTRSDVYCLGALLFELLIGVAPLDAQSRKPIAFDEMLRTIREQDRPTLTARLGTLDSEAAAATAYQRRTESTSLRRELRGELDWIVAKALSRERERRYGSASDLAADVARHLRSEPIAAGPPGTAYRVRKFMRRHRLGVVSGGIVALALVVAVISTSAGMILATRAERQSRRDAATAQAINSFLLGTLAATNPDDGLGKDVTVIEALDSSLGAIEETFADQPEIEAAIRSTVGSTYRVIGRYDDAEAQLRAALAIRERELGPVHADVAISLGDLGLLYQDRGDLSGAEALYRRALEIDRQVHGSMDEQFAVSLGNLAGVLVQSGRHADAEALLRETVATFRQELGEHHPMVAQALNNLGGALMRQGHYDEAESLYRESMAIIRRELPHDHPGVAYGASALAGVLRRKGQCDQAEPLYLESIEVFQVALGPGHWREGSARSGYGACLMTLGRLDEAEDQLQLGLSALESHEGSKQWRDLARQRLAELHEARSISNEASSR